MREPQSYLRYCKGSKKIELVHHQMKKEGGKPEIESGSKVYVRNPRSLGSAIGIAASQTQTQVIAQVRPANVQVGSK